MIYKCSVTLPDGSVAPVNVTVPGGASEEDIQLLAELFAEDIYERRECERQQGASNDLQAV